MVKAKTVSPHNQETSNDEEKILNQKRVFDLSPIAQTGERGLVPYDPLQMYLLEIKNYSLLTREEEVELAIRYKEKNDQENFNLNLLGNQYTGSRLPARHLQFETCRKDRYGFPSILDKKPPGSYPGRECGIITGRKKI